MAIRVARPIVWHNRYIMYLTLVEATIIKDKQYSPEKERGSINLTLNMLNCFKDYKRYIHILNQISNLAWPKWMKLSLEQHYILYVLHSQYHACWCTGDFRSQCISRHDIDPQSRNIPSPASEELTHCKLYEHFKEIWIWILISHHSLTLKLNG